MPSFADIFAATCSGHKKTTVLIRGMEYIHNFVLSDSGEAARGGFL